MLNILKNMLHKISVKYFIMRHDGCWWRIKKTIQKTNREISLTKAREAYKKVMFCYGSWIGFNATFGNKPTFPDGMIGIFISDGARIGRNAVIFQHVTIGSNTLPDSNGRGAPVIGKNCYIGAGAKIIGNVKIGDNCRIGANCVVFKDIPTNSVVVLPAPRVITKKTQLNNRYFPRSINALGEKRKNNN